MNNFAQPAISIGRVIKVKGLIIKVVQLALRLLLQALNKCSEASGEVLIRNRPKLVMKSQLYRVIIIDQ